MKKTIKFLSMMAVMLFGSMLFAACGDDDDDTTTNNGQQEQTVDTSIVGYWHAFVKASNPDDLMLRYQHKLYYAFTANGKFQMITSYFTPEVSEAELNKALEDAIDLKSVVDQTNPYDYQIWYWAGDYTIKGNEIYLYASETSTYDCWAGKWYKDKNAPASSTEQIIKDGVPITFKLGAGTMTLSSDTRIDYHHTHVGEFTRLSKAPKFPNVPDPDPIVGRWIIDFDDPHHNTFEFDIYGNCMNKQWFGNDEQHSVTERRANYTYDNGNLSYTFYQQISYEEDVQTGRQSNYNVVEIEDGTPENYTVTFSNNNNTMTLWGREWTRDQSYN